MLVAETVQWQPDESVLPDDVKAALESREAGSNALVPASAATKDQQQVLPLT